MAGQSATNGDRSSAFTSDIAMEDDHISLKPPAPTLAEYTAAVSSRRALLRAADSAVAGYNIESIFTIPHATHVHALAAPPCFSHIYTGGADGFIRRYALHATLNGTGVDNPLFANLTMKLGGVPALAAGADQRAPVLTGYWENEEPGEWANDLLGAGTSSTSSLEERKTKIRWGAKVAAVGSHQSPVYSLAIQQEELWGLSGTSSGTINLFTIRHDEGQIRHVFRSNHAMATAGHHPKGPVSVLTLADHETSVLSGGWDNRIIQWDLNTGTAARSYLAHAGQISSLSFRPLLSSEPAIIDLDDANEKAVNGESPGRIRADEDGSKDSPLSSASSSTGVAAALVQPNKDSAPSGKVDAAGDVAMADADNAADDGGSEADADGEEVDDDALLDLSTHQQQDAAADTAAAASASRLMPRGPPPTKAPILGSAEANKLGNLSNDVFMSTSINGEVMIWDRRVSDTTGDGAVRALPKSTTKGGGWCTSACWSSNGHQIIVGRRSAVAEVYDIRHYSTSTPTVQNLKLHSATGPISAVHALPGGRHVLTASNDNVRLWDMERVGAQTNQSALENKKSPPPFVIVPGHQGGVASSLLVDARGQYMLTASGNRGWEGQSSESVVIHSIRAKGV